jgi:ubiquinone/menaquinone biosynthesis C-methylase UbiE
MKEDKPKVFDKFAENYRQIHSESIKKISGADSFYFAEYKVKEMMRFEKDHDCKVLDLGCGDGTTEFFFGNWFPKFRITGIDVSPKSIEEALRKNLKNSVFQILDNDTIPFENNSFDIVFVAGVLHHIDEAMQQGIITEIFRVLKPNGRFYLFEHNPFNPLTKYLVNTCDFDKGVKLLTSKKTKSLLIKSGFKVQNLIYTIFFPRNRFFKLLIPLEKYINRLPLGGQYYFRAIKG